MHISLPHREGHVLMGSDRPPGQGQTTFGDSVWVMVALAAPRTGRRIFDALSVRRHRWRSRSSASSGATITAQLIDRFGINWHGDQLPPAG